MAWKQENRLVVGFGFVTFCLLAIVMSLAIIPGYVNPTGRLYTSRFGYPELLRLTKRPFPVSAEKAQRRTLDRHFLGSGVVRGDEVLLTLVPVGRLVSVKVREGEFVRRGQLLAEIESTRARLNLMAAESALLTAKAELERVKIGSNYQLRFERPKIEAILFNISDQQQSILGKIVDVEKRLQTKFYQSLFSFLMAQVEQLGAISQKRQAEVSLDMAKRGLEQSNTISNEAVRVAELATELRKLELDDCQIHSPIDGIVERKLVSEGEFNLAPGTPAFVIASQPYFQAQFDQRAWSRFPEGTAAEVHLEAYQGVVLGGVVESIMPFVNYDRAGPETPRSVLPMGSGGPRWPLTYPARIAIDPHTLGGRTLAHGSTGIARISVAVDAVVLPREGVVSVSGGKGLVYLVDGDHFKVREVSIGAIEGNLVEILSGVKHDDLVITGGHHALVPGDLIVVHPHGDGK